jgi:hypothetical protein
VPVPLEDVYEMVILRSEGLKEHHCRISLSCGTLRNELRQLMVVSDAF